MSDFIERYRLVISRVLVAGLLVLICVTDSAWDDAHELVGEVLMAIGLILIGVAVVGRLWCNLYIVGYKNQQLLTTGPYSLCRNPLYFFSAIGGIGVGLFTGTFSFAVMIAGLFVFTYQGVIQTEEQRQLQLHGKVWEDYVTRVPRFFPNWRGFTEPETYVVYPQTFRHHVQDAVWFVWVAAVLTIVAGMRDVGWLPTVFALP